MLVLAACDPSPDPSGPTPASSPTAAASQVQHEGTILRWAVTEPIAITPSAVVDDTGLLILDTLFDSLTAVTADGTVTPRAALDWTAFDSGRRWLFDLRDGARYHDGTPVVAQDFVDAWSATVAEGRTGGHLQDVVGYRALRDGRQDHLTGARALDDVTLEVRLTRPNMELPAIVAHPSLAPLPPHAFEQPARFAERPVGNGPYQMVEPWAHGQFIRVARVDGWRNGPQNRSNERVREIVFRIIDIDAGYVAFQQGRIDVAAVPAGALQQARRAYGSARHAAGPGVVDVPTPDLYFLGMRVDQPPWDDPELRRALSRAIDRRGLVEANVDQRFDAARSLVPPWLPGGGAVVCDTCLHLPSLAEATFERAGVTDLVLSFDKGGGHEAVVERIRSDLAAIGVTVEPRGLVFEDHIAALERGDLALYRFGWRAQYASAGAMLEPLLRSGSPREAGDGANYGGYASEEVDRLIDEARTTESPDEREATWAQVERIAVGDQAVVPLFTFRQRTAISERIENLTLTPWGTATPERAGVVVDP
jgi:ABC-type oligopeptide transport system substrate-binding subunit